MFLYLLWNMYAPECIFLTNTRYVFVMEFKYQGAELQSVYFITNTKYSIICLALTQLYPVLLARWFQVADLQIYILCSIKCISLNAFISPLTMHAFM